MREEEKNEEKFLYLPFIENKILFINQSPEGAGTAAKLVNQLLFGVHATGASEALALENLYIQSSEKNSVPDKLENLLNISDNEEIGIYEEMLNKRWDDDDDVLMGDD